MSSRVAALAALLIVALSGCAPKQPFKGPTLADDLRDLERDVDVLPPFPVPAGSTGSLWTDAGPGAALVRDTRAFRTNDLVTISIQESSLGSNQASTDLDRSSEADFGASTAFGLEKAATAAGSFALNKVLSTTSESSFSGDGSTSRGNTMRAFITARVMRVLPNGDLVIGGQKTVMINRERQILTLVGTVRPVDVDARNRVPSSSVGDLTVRLWGRGEVDATVRQGWFMRILNRIWPF